MFLNFSYFTFNFNRNASFKKFQNMSIRLILKFEFWILNTVYKGANFSLNWTIIWDNKFVLISTTRPFSPLFLPASDFTPKFIVNQIMYKIKQNLQNKQNCFSWRSIQVINSLGLKARSNTRNQLLSACSLILSRDQQTVIVNPAKQG